jgi:hypothetical protein
MRFKILFLLCFFVLFTHTASAQDAVSDLLGRINSLRGTLGLPPYALNSQLSAAASSHAQWMVDNDTVSHTGAGGSRPSDRVAATGYNASWVSENIYGGTMATPDDAWNFWINSPIHYAGLTSTNYTEIGIGVGRGDWGQAFVLVFGRPGSAPPPAPPAASGNGGGSGGGEQVAAAPSFVRGVDASGNIMHEIQPGDTVGHIALLYGYTWDDVPYMLELNGITDVRDLEIGAIFLVPPHDGTWTPTPGGTLVTETPAPALTAQAGLALDAAFEATLTAPPPTPTPPIGLAAEVPAAFLGDATPASTDLGILPTPTAQNVAMLPTTTPLNVTPPPPVEVTAMVGGTQVALALTPDLAPVPQGVQRGESPVNGWLIAAVGLQVVVIGLAAAEFWSRAKKKKPKA